ncbi:MAG: 3-methyladenine DNA glycosylase [Verrucomicrobia bacterium]|nr:3-methyladenine DNA glycosylase [Verrucomicrobiota bacterium]
MVPTLSSAAETALPEPVWLARRAAHAARVRPWVEPRLERRSRGEKDPIEDFLFEYYSFSPGELLRWHPGLGVALGGERATAEYGSLRHYRATSVGVLADPASLSPSRRQGLTWIAQLLEKTSARPALFACSGLHEWAMVYRSPEIRHAAWPLRLSESALAEFVESQAVCCTHYDAFRFFTEPARPLNRLQPTRASQPELEQAGCLHANMDLYKWAMKLLPFVPSELAADAFALAREIRVLDMRASPYDFAALGLAPVRIETEAGRTEYAALQRDFAARARPLRLRLLAAVRAIEAALA